MEKLKEVVNNPEFETRCGSYNSSRQFYTCCKDAKTNDWHCTNRVFYSFNKNHIGSFGNEDVNICKHIPGFMRSYVLCYKYPRHIFHEYASLKN